MNSNLLLIIGPLIGLSVARMFGPWRLLPALAAAALGQIVVFCGYGLWQQFKFTHRKVASANSAWIVARATPTLGGRLTAITVLLVIAALIAALALGAQALASRLSNGPPPAI
jgi:hypothetical protein